MAAIIFVSNWPAGPTNGSPCTSSSAPGASPTNIIFASRLPTPTTTFLPRRACAQHTASPRTRSRNASIRAALSPGGIVNGTGDGIVVDFADAEISDGISGLSGIAGVAAPAWPDSRAGAPADPAEFTVGTDCGFRRPAT